MFVESEDEQSFQLPAADDDASLFATPLATIKLISGDPDGSHYGRISNLSSPQYSRPMRLQFIHETTQILKEEEEYIYNQITSL